jgi:hypothetical protein
MSNQLPKQLPEPQYQRPLFIQQSPQLKRRLSAVLVCSALSVAAINVLRNFSTQPMPTAPNGFNPSYTVGYLTFYGLIAVSLILLMSTIAAISYLIQGVVASIHRRQIRVTCPTCTTLNQAKHYVEGNGCKTCGSHFVYCERCGKAVDFVHFFPGNGCPLCGHRYFHTK